MKYLYVILFLLVFVACGKKQQQKEQGEQVEQEIKTEVTPPAIEKPTIPFYVTDAEGRANYAIEHYWDHFDFSDTTYIHFPEITEQAFSDYLFLLSHVSEQLAASSIKEMLKKSETDSIMYVYFTGLYEKYLFDPNSPMRNDEHYIPVLESVIESPVADETTIIRSKHLLQLALKNRVGDKALDFVYTLLDGTTGKMSAIKADCLILYFYNPDCETCKETTMKMSVSPVLKTLMENGKVKVLAIYPDEDIMAWNNHLTELPNKWIKSFDKRFVLRNEELYDLKAMPTLYLLDKDKKVLLKDVPFEQLETYLYTNFQL